MGLNHKIYLLNEVFHQNMKANFTPKSNLGKLSLALIALMPIFICIGMSFTGFYKSVPAGKTILQDIFVRPGIALSMLAGFVSGIAAFFCGVFGIIREKDYSVLVFISTILGFLVLLWVFAEILFPH